MIARYLEAIFRHKLLLAIPPLLIPLLVAPIVIFTMPPSYQAITGVWVDKPRYLIGQDDGASPWITPAQFQANRLNEMLQTRAFLNGAASRTTLAPLVGNEKGEERIREAIGRGVSVQSRGERLLVVTFKSDKPQMALQLGNAVVEEFRERSMNERASQASFAITFIEARLREAEDRLNVANEALRKYVAANPRLTNLDPSRSAAGSAAARNGLPTAAIDPQLAELLKRAEIEQKEVERARGTLEQARFDSSAGIEAQDMRFQVVDPARLPTSPVSERRKVIMFVALASMIGLGISAALAVFLVASDRTIRNEADMHGIWDVIGVVPRLGPSRVTRAMPLDLARLQVGLRAGTALPSGMETSR